MFILTNLFLNFNFHDDEIFTRSAKYFFSKFMPKITVFSKTTRFSSWTMINSDQRHVFSHLVVQSYHKLDVLQHYFIISLSLVSVTRSLSPFSLSLSPSVSVTWSVASCSKLSKVLIVQRIRKLEFWIRDGSYLCLELSVPSSNDDFISEN